MLSFTDILVPCMPLAAAVLAVMKDTTTGQIAFLQQLTGNRAVLREAISRLNTKYNPETTASHVRISEVDANLISSRADRGLFSYLIEATMREFQIGPANAYTIVTNRSSD